MTEAQGGFAILSGVPTGGSQALLSRYRILDVARKVVGVGSVGTSCWVVLLEEQGAGSPLFLQIKEARRIRTSALSRRQKGRSSSTGDAS